MQVIVDELLVHYEVNGKGPAILLLHGWADSIASFKNLSNKLAEKYKVISVDLPGFGSSQQPNVSWDLHRYANFTGKFLDKIGGLNLYCILGHSNGGAIAVKGLADSNFSSDKLILMGSAGIREPKKSRKLFFLTIAKIGKLAAFPLPKNAKRRLRRKLYRSAGSDMLIAEHMQETFKLVVSEDVRESAKSLNLPVLLIYGENDQATPVRFGELFHEFIKNSTLVVLPNAGHYVFNDRFDDVIKNITGFLS